MMIKNHISTFLEKYKIQNLIVSQLSPTFITIDISFESYESFSNKDYNPLYVADETHRVQKLKNYLVRHTLNNMKIKICLT